MNARGCEVLINILGVVSSDYGSLGTQKQTWQFDEIECLHSLDGVDLEIWQEELE